MAEEALVQVTQTDAVRTLTLNRRVRSIIVKTRGGVMLRTGLRGRPCV